jgi:hypothetical protein
MMKFWSKITRFFKLDRFQFNMKSYCTIMKWLTKRASQFTLEKSGPRPCNIKTLAGSTRRCPGHYIKIIKCIVRAKVARKVSPKVLHLLFNKLCLKITDHASRSTWGPGPSRSRLLAQKYDLLPLKQTFPPTFVL